MYVWLVLSDTSWKNKLTKNTSVFLEDLLKNEGKIKHTTKILEWIMMIDNKQTFLHAEYMVRIIAETKGESVIS